MTRSSVEVPCNMRSGPAKLQKPAGTFATPPLAVHMASPNRVAPRAVVKAEETRRESAAAERLGHVSVFS
jgi:hypothetical protein